MNKAWPFCNISSDLEYGLHFANVLSRWASKFFTCEVGVIEGTAFFLYTQIFLLFLTFPLLTLSDYLVIS